MNKVIVRITAGNLVDEQLHAAGIGVRQRQTVEASVLRAHGAIGVSVLLRHALSRDPQLHRNVHR